MASSSVKVEGPEDFHLLPKLLKFQDIQVLQLLQFPRKFFQIQQKLLVLSAVEYHQLKFPRLKFPQLECSQV